MGNKKRTQLHEDIIILLVLAIVLLRLHFTRTIDVSLLGQRLRLLSPLSPSGELETTLAFYIQTYFIVASTVIFISVFFILRDVRKTEQIIERRKN